MSSAASAAAPPQIDPAGLLLFSVQLDELTLTDGLAAYGDPQDPLLPVGELSRLLELDVEVMPAERRIVGRIGESRRALLLDLATHTARDGPRTVDLTAEDVAVTPNEIYLRASAARKLLPLKIEVQPDALNIKLTAQELLPIQGRLQRVARRREGGQTAVKEDVLKIPSPYRLYSWPAFDVNLGAGFQSTAAPKFPLRYDVRGAADLLHFNAQGYLGSDETGKPSTARLLFQQRSVEGRLLGPLHGRELSFGDVFTPALALGPRGAGGRGISFSTVPLDQTNVFNRIDLRGELPLGYDVELYVNDVLRSGQNTPTKGRYEFLNVPLSPGVNVIRIVTYGQRGERNEDVRVVNVGAGLLQRGEATFEFGAVQQDREVVPLRGASGVPGALTIPSGWRMVASANYGLTPYLTVAGGAALIPTKAGDERQVYTLGARTSLFGFATNLDLAGDDRNGRAAAVGVAGQLFGLSLVARHTQFAGGFLDENGAGDATRPLSSRTEGNLDSNLQLRGQIIPMSVRALREAHADGGVDLSGSVRASAAFKGVLFSTGLEYGRTTPASGAASERLSGFFAGSTYRSYRWQLRSTLDYDILPELKARALAITADRQISDTMSLRFGVGQSLDDFASFNLTASSIFRLRVADLALNMDYNNADHGVRLGAQLNFGLRHNPAEGGYGMSRPGPGSGGSVLFEAFLDRNGNGVFDAGDEPVPNVGIEGAEQRAVTGPDGRVFITGVGAGPTARLLVSLENVENASVEAPPSTIQFSPHAGSVTVIRYPMKPTGDVMVKVALRRPDGNLVGVSAVQLRLTDAKGKAFEASTEFDGSASFQGLPVGIYRLELDPEQAKRLRMSLIQPVTITIKGDGGFTPDAAAEVKFQPRPEQQPQETASVEKQ